MSDQEIINHARWLIDNKLNYLSSFRSRTMEILGLNSAIMIFMWSQLDKFLKENEDSTISEIFLITSVFIYTLLVVFEIFIFLYVSIPRKSEMSLDLHETSEEIKTNLKNYEKQISTYLASRARATRSFFRMFIVQVLIIMIILISRPELFTDLLRWSMIIALVVVAIIVVVAKER